MANENQTDGNTTMKFNNKLKNIFSAAFAFKLFIVTLILSNGGLSTGQTITALLGEPASKELRSQNLFNSKYDHSYLRFPTQVTASFERNAIYPDTIDYRIAKRLKKRLAGNIRGSFNVHALAKAIREKRYLMQKELKVRFVSDDKKINAEWDIRILEFPTWVAFSHTGGSAGFHIDPGRIAEYLKMNPPGFFKTPVDITVSSIALSGTVTKAKTDGTASPGYDFKADSAANMIAESLNKGLTAIDYNLVWREGIINYLPGKEVRALSLIGEGKSNYIGSPPARIHNIRKALNQHLNNILVQPGETFSFNQTLSGPVTLENGWKMAKVIFEGDQLRLSPGGGICQASTTAYRAIINSGLPVLERRGHSLFVSYYKQYGVGIDATIFPGVQDLAFKNDTEGPILIQAYDTEEKDVFVKFYGIPDGRKVAMDGPYFKANAPDSLLVNERKISPGEIVWMQKIIRPDGTEENNQIISRYKTIPASLPYEFLYAGKHDEEAPEPLHTAAMN